MIPGIYISAGGMLLSEGKHSVYANNLANSATVGFKSHIPVGLGFYSMFRRVGDSYLAVLPKSAPAGGAKLVETFPDLSMGPLKQTDNPLDIAIQGPGFLVIQTPQGPRYTRAGNLTRDQDGNLCTPEGYQVLGANNQPISINGTTINIAQDGTVTVDGVQVGQIQCVEFASPERLTCVGENLYTASVEVENGKTPATRSSIRQGYLEWSNTNIPKEMVNLTLGLRTYEANQRVLSAINETIGRLIDQIGLG